MKKVKRDQDAKEQPVVSYFLYYDSKRLAGFAVKVHKDTLAHSLNEMNDSHFECKILSWLIFLLIFRKVHLLIKAEVIYLEPVAPEQREGYDGPDVDQDLRETV